MWSGKVKTDELPSKRKKGQFGDERELANPISNEDRTKCQVGVETTVVGDPAGGERLVQLRSSVG